MRIVLCLACAHLVMRLRGILALGGPVYPIVLAMKHGRSQSHIDVAKYFGQLRHSWLANMAGIPLFQTDRLACMAAIFWIATRSRCIMWRIDEDC